MNNNALIMGMQISFHDPALNSFGYVPRNGIVGLYGSSVFNLLRNCHAVFTAGAPLYVPTSSAQEFQFVHVLTNTCVVFCFEVDILMNMKWYLVVVLICVSVMISDIEHLFICFLAICVSSWEKCLFKSFAHFWIELFDFLLLLSWKEWILKSDRSWLQSRPLRLWAVWPKAVTTESSAISWIWW